MIVRGGNEEHSHSGAQAPRYHSSFKKLTDVAASPRGSVSVSTENKVDMSALTSAIPLSGQIVENDVPWGESTW